MNVMEVQYVNILDNENIVRSVMEVEYVNIIDSVQLVSHAVLSLYYHAHFHYVTIKQK